MEADVVVIGGGGAGLTAAMAAAEKGASVIVLEKHALGGSSAMAFGIFGAESPVQKRMGIDCSRDACFKQAMEFANWRINPRIMRAFVDKSGDTIRWLEEKSVKFVLDTYSGVAEGPFTFHLPSGFGVKLIEALARNCRELGVHLLVRTPARKILTSSTGEIAGVLARTGKEEFVIKTRSVIIATGGFGGNKRLLKKYCPEYVDNMMCIGQLNRGDGLAMATEIGADTEGLGYLMLSGPLYFHGVNGTIGIQPDIIQFSPHSAAMSASAIRVNKKGQRFVDESVSPYIAAHAVVRQPEGFAYSIVDIELIRNMAIPQFTPPGDEEEEHVSSGPRRFTKEEAANHRDFMKTADSLDEIAEWIGAEPKVLKTTVDEYNIHCEQGRDPIFSKEQKYLKPLSTPPYCAIRWHVTFPTTTGGIMINERMEVLDKQHDPIPGVYAAGVDTGGWETETYCIGLTGHAYGYAVNSGRIAGENAAEYVNPVH